jgi:flagellar basal body rod protein FlgB
VLYGFFNRVSAAPDLSNAIDASTQRMRGIAQRVSAASLQGETGFTLDAAQANSAAAVDVEAEMVSLADETLRQEAMMKLLQGTYQRLRGVVRDR